MATPAKPEVGDAATHASPQETQQSAPRAAIRPRGSKPVGIKEVAARAGVSWKTVSNVVHERSNVRPETRERVLAAIRELGYRPNLAGRQLRQGRTNTLLFAVSVINSPYFGALAETLIARAERRGISVLIELTHGDREAERRIAAGARHRSVDGIIFNPISLSADDFAAARDDTPLVVLGERLYGANADHVSIDNVASARELTQHCLDRGARSLAYVGGHEPRDATGYLRFQGFREQLRVAGIEVEPSQLHATRRYDREEGRMIGARIANAVHLPDAVICANDLLAMGVMHELQQRGVSVPGQVRVAGWDNAPESEYLRPALTTIAPDIGGVAERAIDEVLRRIDGDDTPWRDSFVPHRLIARESTGSARPPR
ncbi:LacI family DNA-binding transcriptional regulator [Micrococcales bacterium 31B]|nr:LacI family DNA-binding transcriptional regulator [Micrococcales bacterium 31B]